MSKLKIITRLWSHITDLQLYINGNRKKSLEQIEMELDITKMYCRPYADADDLDEEEQEDESGNTCKTLTGLILLQKTKRGK